eukprot:Awhi_evm1s2916
MYNNLIFQALIFSFGYRFREQAYLNWPLIMNVFILFVITTLAILLPPSNFTNLWHMASYPFNGENPTGVWLLWQQA